MGEAVGMNLLLEIEFESKTEYYSIIPYISSGGIQYDCRIEEAKLLFPGCQLGVYESKKAVITLEDSDGTVAQHLETENTKGIVSRLINGNDETLIANLFLTDFDLSEFGKVSITISDRFQELDSNINLLGSYIINDTNLETRPPVINIGKYFNFFTGNFTTYSSSFPGKNGLRCYRADTQGTGSLYIIGVAGTITDANMPTVPQYIADPAGNSVTPVANWSIFKAADGFWYVQDIVGTPPFNDVDYVDINFTLTTNLLTKQLISDVGGEFFPNFNFTSDGILNLLAYTAFHVDPDPLDVPAGDEWKYNHFSFNQKKSGIQILSEICSSTGLNFFIRPNRLIKFSAIDINDITYKTFQQWECSGFEPRGGDSQQRQSTNEISTEFGKNPDGSFERSEISQNWESRADTGYWVSKTQQNILIQGNDRSVNVPAGGAVVKAIAKRTGNLVESPSKNITYEMDIDQGIGATPFDLWKFNHVFLKKPDTLHEIIRINHDFMSHRTQIEFKDRSYVETIDKAQVFRLQGVFPGSTHIFFDDLSPGGENYYTSRFFNGAGTETWTRTYQKFGLGSVVWNGTNWSKSFGTQNLNKAWQIWDNTKWCFFAWVRFPTLGNTEIMMRIQDPADTTNQNFYDIRKGANNQLRILVFEGGAQTFSFTSSPGVITSNTTWYHVGLVKNGNNYGWYIDGTLQSYLSSAYTPTGTPFRQSSFFAEDSQANFYYWVMPEWCIWIDANGPFLSELLPDAGLTSSYTVPTGAVTNAKGKFINFTGIN
jgi:hypothetical protein